MNNCLICSVRGKVYQIVIWPRDSNSTIFNVRAFSAEDAVRKVARMTSNEDPNDTVRWYKEDNLDWDVTELEISE